MTKFAHSLKLIVVLFFLFQSAGAMANSTPEEIFSWEAKNFLMSTSQINEPIPQISKVAPVSINPAFCNGSISAAAFAQAFQQLTQVISFGFTSGLPHVDGEQYGFKSHFDWHSSVEAHWALLTISRLTGNTAIQRNILKRLNLSELKKINKGLAAEPTFENPYGRAWFVMMLRELIKAPIDSSTKKFATALREQLASDLVTHLEQSDVSAASGLHSSWIFTAFLLKASGNFSSATSSRLAQVIAKNTSAIQQLKPDGDSNGVAFLNPSAISSLVLRTPFNEKTITLDEIEKQFAQNTQDVFLGHRVGLLITEFWPKALSSRNDHSSCVNYISRLNELLLRPDVWAYNFVRTSHWIPQFMMMSIYIALGETQL